MYCINCGVKLADSEKVCPLCGTSVYHPDIKRDKTPSPYPEGELSSDRMKPMGLLFVITFLFLQPILITLFCDLQLNMAITWSAYASGGILLAYIVFILPAWFKRPNPVIFVPIDFAAATLFLFYINYATGMNWFLTLALPLSVYAALLVTSVVTLYKYVRRGYLYIYGGALIALAAYFILIEMMSGITFGDGIRLVWSFYPAISCSILGIMLIIIAICKPIRESLKKIFFI